MIKSACQLPLPQKPCETLNRSTPPKENLMIQPDSPVAPFINWERVAQKDSPILQKMEELSVSNVYYEIEESSILNQLLSDFKLTPMDSSEIDSNFDLYEIPDDLKSDYLSLISEGDIYESIYDDLYAQIYEKCSQTSVTPYDTRSLPVSENSGHYEEIDRTHNLQRVISEPSDVCAIAQNHLLSSKIRLCKDGGKSSSFDRSCLLRRPLRQKPKLAGTKKRDTSKKKEEFTYVEKSNSLTSQSKDALHYRVQTVKDSNHSCHLSKENSLIWNETSL